MPRPNSGRGGGLAPALALSLALAACAALPPKAPPVQAPASPPASAESAALAAYYAGVQQSLLSQGLLRTDGGGADSPFTSAQLARNFLRVALYEEYTPSGKRGNSAVVLTRWAVPVRVALHFGDSVPPQRQATDRARIASYLARLARLTGQPIALTSGPEGANFTIAITNVDERRALGPMIAAALPQISPSQIASVTDLNRSTYCLVWTQSHSAQGHYERAFVYIPAEHPDLMRLACLHEEIAQGLGLPNDVGTARPSIFNDDEEFALLTRQDEMFLQILYNPALHPGMTETEARPIVDELARRMLDNNS